MIHMYHHLAEIRSGKCHNGPRVLVGRAAKQFYDLFGRNLLQRPERAVELAGSDDHCLTRLVAQTLLPMLHRLLSGVFAWIQLSWEDLPELVVEIRPLNNLPNVAQYPSFIGRRGQLELSVR